MYSLNRGVWLGVILGIILVVAILAMRGHLVPLVGLLIAVAVGSQLLLASPLRQVIETRTSNGVSNSVRAFTTVKAFELSAQSPVIGFGTTRSSVGSQASIAIGRSPECPLCGNVSIGINGSFFTLLVSTGYAGVLLFFGFWIDQAWRSRRDTSMVGIASQLTLLTAGFYCFFYTIELTVPFVVLALMWRRRVASGGNDEARLSHGPPRHSRSRGAGRLQLRGPAPPPEPESSGALFGAYVSPSEATEPGRISALKRFESALGRHLDVVQNYHEWETGFPTDFDRFVAARGDVLLLSWAATRPSEISAGRYDAMIRDRAMALKRLGSPILLRWRWEMNRPNIQDEIGSPSRLRFGLEACAGDLRGRRDPQCPLGLVSPGERVR